MIWSPLFSWVWNLTPFKAVLWLGNRLATWLGMFHVWRRFRARRSVWAWLFLINMASFSALIGIFIWLQRRSH